MNATSILGRIIRIIIAMTFHISISTLSIFPLAYLLSESLDVISPPLSQHP